MKSSQPSLDAYQQVWNAPSIPPIDMVEGDVQQFEIQLAAPTGVALEYDWSVDGDLAADARLAVKSGHILIAAGSDRVTVELRTSDDDIYQKAKVGAVVFLETKSVDHAIPKVVLTLRDNDARPFLSLESAMLVREAAAGTSLLHPVAVKLSRRSEESIQVTFNTVSVAGGASPVSDYVSVSQSLTFAPGQTSTPIPISILGDTLVEPREEFRLSLSAPINADLLPADAVFSVNIQDAGETGAPEVNISPALTLAESAASQQVRVELSEYVDVGKTIKYVTKVTTGADAATGNVDFQLVSGQVTIPAGSLVAYVPLVINNDQIYEGRIEKFAVDIGATSSVKLGASIVSTISISDSSAAPILKLTAVRAAVEGGVSARVEMVLTGATQATSSFKCKTVDDTAKAGLDYSSVDLPFSLVPPASSQALEIVAPEDFVKEPEEFFLVRCYDALNVIAPADIRVSIAASTFELVKDTLAHGFFHSSLTLLNVSYSGQYLTYAKPVRSVEIRRGTQVETIKFTNAERLISSKPDRFEILISSALYSPSATTITLIFDDLTRSPGVPVQFYAVEVYKPEAAVANSWPLALKQDKDGTLVVHNEFSTSFRTFSPTTTVWKKNDFPIPFNIPVFIYFTSSGKEIANNLSVNSESIVIDSASAYWFAQGGGFPSGTGDILNLARVVKHSPPQTTRLYNIPGNNRGLYGLEYDETRKRMWYTTGQSKRGEVIARSAVLGFFDPTAVANDLLQFPGPEAGTSCLGGSTTQVGKCSNNSKYGCFNNLDCFNANRVCDAGTVGCYKEYEIPGFIAAHIYVDSLGDAWFAGFWGGNYIGRLVVQTGRVYIYPLPAARGTSSPVSSTKSGPWEILADKDGNVVVNEYFDSTLSRFNVSKKDNAECLILNAGGRNPCIDEVDIPGANLAKHFPHTIAKDKAGRIWFTHSTVSFYGSDPKVPATLGVTTADLTQTYMLPGFSRLPGLADHTGGAGIVVDTNSDDVIWFNDYEGGRLIKLLKLK